MRGNLVESQLEPVEAIQWLIGEKKGQRDRLTIEIEVLTRALATLVDIENSTGTAPEPIAPKRTAAKGLKP